MNQVWNILNTAVESARYFFDVMFLRTGAFMPYMGALAIVFTVRFLLIPIVGSFKMSSDKAQKPKKGQ